MPIIVNLDVMLAKRKMRSKELAARIGITEQNLSILKAGRAEGVRFETAQTPPGPVRSYAADDPALRPWRPPEDAPA